MDVNEATLFMRINIAAQRARQIMQGAAPKIHSQTRKPAAIAVQELNDGLIEAYTSAELPDPPEEAVLDDSDDGEDF